MDGDVRINPYLTGNFAPICSEDDFTLEVEGKIPAGLAGALYRTGPNPQFEPIEPHHWFFGDGMVHGFFLEDGQVRYRNRWVRTPKWALEREHGRALFHINPMLADPASHGREGGVANTHIVPHAGRLLALEEGHPPTEMDAATLETRGYVPEYRGRVTAHPKIDPATGEMVWFAYGVGDTPLAPGMSFGVTAADGTVVQRQEFQAPYCSMVHDFCVTENHVLFPVLPLTGDLGRAMRGGPAFAWEPEKGAYVGVMRRDADVSTIRWFEVEPCYVFHPLNAWEEGTKLFCDVMRYETAPLFPNSDGSPREGGGASLYRWTIDLAAPSNAVHEERLDDLEGEFPRVGPRVETRKHRHGWYAADRYRQRGVGSDTLAHLDFATGRRQLFELGDGDYTSEPVFAPRSADADEGDGWILAVAYRAAENRSDLLVFEAQDLAAGPIAVAKLPRRVPFGFHGSWLSA